MNETPRVALVTGASRGMGAATAHWLAAAGCRIALAARSGEKLEALAQRIEENGGSAIALPLDVADAAQCRRAVEKTLETFGRLDALVNNAGLADPIARVSEADAGQWAYNIGVNLLGPFYLTGAALPALRRSRGRVINVSSGAAHSAIVGWSAYCAAKAGLTHFTRVVAAEEPEVTCIALRPGVVDTDMQAAIRERGADAMEADKWAYFRRLKSEQRLEPPETPARAIAWLALHAPRSWSGEFVEYDDPRIATAAAEAFGGP